MTKKSDVLFRKSGSALYYRRQAALVKCCGAPRAATPLCPERVCSRRPPAPPQEHRVDDPGVTSPSRPLQIGRAKMGGRGRAEGSEGTPGRKKRRQKQGSPPQVGDEITTELDSYTLPSLSPLARTRRGNWRLFICSCRARLPSECRSARHECAPATIQHGLQVLRHAATLVCCSTLRWSFVATCSAACNMP